MQLTVDVCLDALVGKHTGTVAVDLIANSHVFTQDGDILETCPSAYCAVPTDNCALHPCVLLDLAVLQQDGALQTHTLAHFNIGSNDHVGTDLAVLANLCRRVNHDIAAVNVGLAGGGKKLATMLGEGGQVEAGAREEVLGLTDVHPEALQVEAVKLAVLDDRRESLLLDGGRAQLDAVQNRRVEDVDTSVDAVSDELDGLLDEAVDARRVVGLVDNDTVLARLLDLCDNDRTLLAVGLVESGQLFEGEFANDVGVEDEERRIVLAEGLGRQLERASGAQWLGLDGEFDVYAVLFLVALEGLGHDLGAVVDGKNDVGHTSSGQGLDLVDNHGSVAELDKGFGEGEGERAQTGAEATDENKSWISVSRNSGMVERIGMAYPSCWCVFGGMCGGYWRCRTGCSMRSSRRGIVERAKGSCGGVQDQ